MEPNDDYEGVHIMKHYFSLNCLLTQGGEVLLSFLGVLIIFISGILRKRVMKAVFSLNCLLTKKVH